MRRSNKIREIWLFMSKRFKNKWSHNFDGDEMDVKLWEAAITGLKPEQIDQALEKYLDFNIVFSPDCGEFRAMCLGDVYPDSENLYDEVVYWDSLDYEKKTKYGLFILQNLDVLRFRTANAANSKSAFKKAYEKLCKAIDAGHEFKEMPKPTPQITHDFKPDIDGIKAVRKALIEDIVKKEAYEPQDFEAMEEALKNGTLVDRNNNPCSAINQHGPNPHNLSKPSDINRMYGSIGDRCTV